MSFKERLKEQRLSAGLTQVDLAERAKVTSRTIQNYELGTRAPKNIEIVQRLATALGCPVEQLLERRDVCGRSAAKGRREGSS